MIQYETDTPVQEEYREAALSALEKFKSRHNVLREKMSDVDKIWDERTFNYAFPADTPVMFDKHFMFALAETNYSFVSYISQYEKHFDLIGKVVCYDSDLHAFGRGYAYTMDVDFHGTIVKNIIAGFLIRAANIQS